jgi:hypothetical protein
MDRALWLRTHGLLLRYILLIESSHNVKSYPVQVIRLLPTNAPQIAVPRPRHPEQSKMPQAKRLRITDVVIPPLHH